MGLEFLWVWKEVVQAQFLSHVWYLKIDFQTITVILLTIWYKYWSSFFFMEKRALKGFGPVIGLILLIFWQYTYFAYKESYFLVSILLKFCHVKSIFINEKNILFEGKISILCLALIFLFTEIHPLQKRWCGGGVLASRI